jgi:uncharacterized protein (DUF58 family)
MAGMTDERRTTNDERPTTDEEPDGSSFVVRRSSAEHRAPSTEHRLLEPEFLRKLEQLSLVAKRTFRGQMKGERRSPKRGASVEFADYRNYTPGDDLRRVDWNTYARLERLFLKLFHEEEDLNVYLLVDGSRSMGFGSPTKLEYAQKVAAALGYVGLTEEDRVGATIFGDRLRAVLTPVRGRGQVFPFFRFLQSAEAEGVTAFDVALKEYALRTRRPGVAIVISDFFGPEVETGLKALLYRKFELTLIHVLDPGELNPELVGDLKLVDAETGETREITVTPGLLRDYQRALEAFCGGLQSFARRYGVDYIRASTATPFEDLVLQTMRRSGRVA